MKLKFEKRKGITYQVFPKNVIASVLHDHDDPFFNHLKQIAVQVIRKVHLNKHNKSSFCAIGYKENWINFQEEHKKENSAHYFLKVTKKQHENSDKIVEIVVHLRNVHCLMIKLMQTQKLMQ